MEFFINNIKIYFPYEKIYPEQYKYIAHLINVFENTGHCLIEMPSGTGKTISLLSASVSYYFHNRKKKIIYCSHTVSEIEKTLVELEKLINYIQEKETDEKFKNFLGIGLASRKNLCINETVLESKAPTDACLGLISGFSDKKCEFYENIENCTGIPYGVYTLEKLKKYGTMNKYCPYYLSRKLLNFADCVVFSYNYILDPKIRNIISSELNANSILIFDEAHNIDNVCIEALTMTIKRIHVNQATAGVIKIEKRIKEYEDKSKEILLEEYKNMKKKLNENKAENKFSKSTKDFSEYIPAVSVSDFLPGSLRKALHFLSALKRLLEFYKTKLRSTHLTTESTTNLLSTISSLVFIEKESINFLSQRLDKLVQTLKLEFDTNLKSLKKIVDFSTLASQYKKGFSVIYEPFDSKLANTFNPYFKLACLDSSIVMKDIFDKFNNVIITSGTLSPINMYPELLRFSPVKIVEILPSLSRNAISPLIISKGNDQILLNKVNDDSIAEATQKITTSFNFRKEVSISRNYGQLILEFSELVPDGLIVFFPSYLYMEEIVSLWSELNLITKIRENKLVFVESKNSLETQKAFQNYKDCVASGRGAILFCVARGNVSEGVDFDGMYGRCVIVLGVPFMYTEDMHLKKRLEYLKNEFAIEEGSFIVFDAMRQTAQALGRVFRNKYDYGLMIMADSRFCKKDKKNKLPKWILSFLKEYNDDLSIEMAANIAKSFFRRMAQPFSESMIEAYDQETVRDLDSSFKIENK